jgi:DNA replicative helicase MCM subunit Mcm2 (Cdc46/Mcm family)
VFQIDDSDDDDPCALSENWTFQPESRRWSRVCEVTAQHVERLQAISGWLTKSADCIQDFKVVHAVYCFDQCTQCTYFMAPTKCTVQFDSFKIVYFLV